MNKTFFGFPSTTPQNTTQNTIAIVGSKCVKKSIHPTLGQEEAVDILRELSREYDTHALHLEGTLDDYDIVDLGNFGCDELTSVVRQLSETGAKILVIGGDHSTTFHTLLGIQPESLLVLDAHLDFEPHESVHHGSFLYHLTRKLSLQNVWILGTRGYSTMNIEVKLATNSENVRIFYSPISPELIKASLKSFPILSVDLDFFDPSTIWGVRVPEAIGFDIKKFLLIMHNLERASLSYIDIVEYSPHADPGFVCGKIVLQLILESLWLLIRSQH